MIKYNIDDNEILRIYVDDEIISEISDVPKTSTTEEIKNLINNVLDSLGYKWNEDGTIEEK